MTSRKFAPKSNEDAKSQPQVQLRQLTPPVDESEKAKTQDEKKNDLAVVVAPNRSFLDVDELGWRLVVVFFIKLVFHLNKKEAVA